MRDSNAEFQFLDFAKSSRPLTRSRATTTALS